MNGIYNGREDDSSRARIPSYVTFDVNITDDVILKETFTLDMYNGIIYYLYLCVRLQGYMIFTV